MLVHVNPGISWHQRYGKAFIQGKLGRITHDPTESDDLTVVLGPNWAKSYHPNCLYVDRAYWGDPDAVSIHWMVHGDKVFDWSGRPGRKSPKLEPMKTGGKTITLCDFQKHKHINGVESRCHPSERLTVEPLMDCLIRHDIAIGGRSTALVDAAIAGLKVITDDNQSPVYPLTQGMSREFWINSLAWHNWTFDDIQSGILWDWLRR